MKLYSSKLLAKRSPQLLPLDQQQRHPIQPMRQHTWLFRFVCRLLRYFSFAILGMAIACLLAATFNAADLLTLLISTWIWIFRLGVMLLCLVAIAILHESLS